MLGGEQIWKDLRDSPISGGSGGDRFVLKSSHLSDIIVDLQGASNLLGLIGGITFTKLTMTSKAGATLKKDGDHLLANLNRVKANLIGGENFTRL